MSTKSLLKRHPISIDDVRVRELYIQGNVHPNDVEEGVEITYSISAGRSEYNSDDKTVIVAVKFETNDNDNKDKILPYTMRVELVARFTVDEENFSPDNVDDWADRNAPIVLIPYLREHVYSLTIRCGYNPLILPLVQVPTFEVKKDINYNT